MSTFTNSTSSDPTSILISSNDIQPSLASSLTSSSSSSSSHLQMIFGNCRPVTNFEKVDRIGKGTYGTVYRAIDKQDMRVVALKRVILHNEHQDGFPITSLREITALRECDRHENCVALLDVVVGFKRDAVFLVFEYCEHDLHQLVSVFKTPFNEAEIKSLILQLLSALRFLHRRDIVHRDIKLSNLLYTSAGILKLADFGMCRRLPSSSRQPMTVTVVTLWYRAPELLLGSEYYSTAVDIWAAGCIFGELLAQKPLFAGQNELDQIRCLFEVLGYPNSRIWPSVNDMPLVRNGSISLLAPTNVYNNLRLLLPSLSEEGFEFLNLCLAYDSKKRLPAKEASVHEYFLRAPYPTHKSMMPTFPSANGEVAQAFWEKARTSRRKEIDLTMNSSLSGIKYSEGNAVSINEVSSSVDPVKIESVAAGVIVDNYSDRRNLQRTTTCDPAIADTRREQVGVCESVQAFEREFLSLGSCSDQKCYGLGYINSDVSDIFSDGIRCRNSRSRSRDRRYGHHSNNDGVRKQSRRKHDRDTEFGRQVYQFERVRDDEYSNRSTRSNERHSYDGNTSKSRR